MPWTQKDSSSIQMSGPLAYRVEDIKKYHDEVFEGVNLEHFLTFTGFVVLALKPLIVDRWTNSWLSKSKASKLEGILNNNNNSQGQLATQNVFNALDYMCENAAPSLINDSLKAVLEPAALKMKAFDKAIRGGGPLWEISQDGTIKTYPPMSLWIERAIEAQRQWLPNANLHHFLMYYMFAAADQVQNHWGWHQETQPQIAELKALINKHSGPEGMRVAGVLACLEYIAEHSRCSFLDRRKLDDEAVRAFKENTQ